jgi:hypothetical protein
VQKRHHTVPHCYLENFTDQDGKVWVLDTKNKIFDTNPKNIFVESHFYRITLKDGTKSVVIENTLSEIEGTYATIFREKISKSIPLTLHEKAQVAVFVSAMMHRTRPKREEMRNMFENLKQNIEEWQKQLRTLTPARRRTLDAIPSSGGAKISLEELEAGLKDFDEHHAADLISQTMHTAQIILNMKWAIWHIEDNGNTFVTSDAPLVVERPAAIKKYGRGTFGSRPGLIYKDTEVTLPLSRNHLFLAGWILDEDSYITVPSEIAEHLNQRTILHSSERIIACSKDKLETIKIKYPPRLN